MYGIFYSVDKWLEKVVESDIKERNKARKD
jgi:hypothetical protein